MSKNFYTLIPLESERLGVAYAPETIFFDFLPEYEKINDWKPFELQLKNGDFSDLQANDLGWTICSEKLKIILNSKRPKIIFIDWLKVYIIDKNGQKKEYFVLHFENTINALNKSESLISGDFVIKPVLNEEKINDLDLFAIRGFGKPIISDSLRNKLVQENITGIDFTKIPVSRKKNISKMFIEITDGIRNDNGTYRGKVQGIIFISGFKNRDLNIEIIKVGEIFDRTNGALHPVHINYHNVLKKGFDMELPFSVNVTESQEFIPNDPPEMI